MVLPNQDGRLVYQKLCRWNFLKVEANCFSFRCVKDAGNFSYISLYALPE